MDNMENMNFIDLVTLRRKVASVIRNEKKASKHGNIKFLLSPAPIEVRIIDSADFDRLETSLAEYSFKLLKKVPAMIGKHGVTRNVYTSAPAHTDRSNIDGLLTDYLAASHEMCLHEVRW